MNFAAVAAVEQGVPEQRRNKEISSDLPTVDFVAAAVVDFAAAAAAATAVEHGVLEQR